MTKLKQIQWKKIIITYFITLISCLLFFFPIDVMSNPTILIDKFFLYIISNIIINTIIIILCIIVVYNINNNFYLKKYYCRILIELLFLSIISTIFGYLFQIIFLRYMDIITYIYRNTIHKQSFFVDFLENAFTLILVELLFQYFKRQEDKIKKERYKYIQLKNQINPHFLFNSLSISISLIKKDQNRAIDYMKKLSLIYRYVLINMDNDFVILEEEIEFIKKYIEILQIRYEKGLNVTYDINDSITNMKIIPMSLQLLVENVVKHNAIYSDNPLNIHIYTEKKNIIVENNIVHKTGIIDSTGIGLKNLNQKYRILCSRNIEVINNTKIFKVKIPLK